METIREILDRNHTLAELISCFEIVKENGDIAVIKFDGERFDRQYTVFISFPAGSREMIRADENALQEAVTKVLRLYIE